MDRRKLVDCCEAIGVEPGRHDALSDATATSALMSFYLDKARREGVRSELLLYPDTAAGLLWPSQPTVKPQLLMEAERHKRIEIRNASPRRTLSLVNSLEKINLDGLLWDDAQQGCLEYLELMRTALVDSVVSDEESQQLADLAEAFGLDAITSNRLKERLLLMLAAQAWSDGFISRDEQTEMKQLVTGLGLSEKSSTKLLKAAETERHSVLSQDLPPLPIDWTLGEPLRVGMRIAFTGCDWEQRERLEADAVASGCRLTGSVSGKTDFLITDGSYVGNKREAAEQQSVRIIHPDDFERMLEFIQPSL